MKKLKKNESKGNLFQQVIEYARKIHVPEFIINEIFEQEMFLSWEEERKMLNWSYDQFVDWYKKE